MAVTTIQIATDEYDSTRHLTSDYLLSTLKSISFCTSDLVTSYSTGTKLRSPTHTHRPPMHDTEGRLTRGCERSRILPLALARSQGLGIGEIKMKELGKHL